MTLAERPLSTKAAGLERTLARVVTEVLAPAPVAAILLLIVGWHSATSFSTALVWGLVSVACAAVVPMAYILSAVRQRGITDRHVRLAHQRPVPLLIGMSSVRVGVALLLVGGVPRDLVALVAAMGVGLGSSLLVTLIWKISIHVAVIAGAEVILLLVFGPGLLGLAPLVPLVGRARVVSSDHTHLHVIGGGLLGALVAAIVSPALR
jgi:hypothetical protein